MEKYKQYVDAQWWNGIRKRDIDSWIQNFEGDEKLPEIILDNIIFYNNLQLKEYARCLANKMREDVYENTVRESIYKTVTDKELEEKWNNYIEHTKILPAEKEGDPASSAHKVIGHWRSALKIGDAVFSNIADVNTCYQNNIRRFVLVDDFCGSGNQMKEVLARKVVIDKIEAEIGKLPENFLDVEIIVAVYVMHKKAKEYISLMFPKVKLLYIDLIDDAYDFFNENALLYENLSIEERRNTIEKIKNIHDKLVIENPDISQYTLNIPVVFEHGCPNNALLLLFAKTDNWKQLFKRGEEI